jgi:hypothetical protein
MGWKESYKCILLSIRSPIFGIILDVGSKETGEEVTKEGIFEGTCLEVEDSPMRGIKVPKTFS